MLGDDKHNFPKLALNIGLSSYAKKTNSHQHADWPTRAKMLCSPFLDARCLLTLVLSLGNEFYLFGSDKEQPSEEGNEEHRYVGGVEEQPPGPDADA
jgi:hypothetical protein